MQPSRSPEHGKLPDPEYSPPLSQRASQMVLGFSGYLIFGKDMVLCIGEQYHQLDPQV
jgi:hypothetical protein